LDSALLLLSFIECLLHIVTVALSIFNIPAAMWHALITSKNIYLLCGARIKGTQKVILYESEVFQRLKIGQENDGFIRKVRDDKKYSFACKSLATNPSMPSPEKS
jgi:hypothetical protein